jgi:hypothetical protein
MHKILFYNKFISCLYMFLAPCAHRQEVRIVLYSLWYHHTRRWPSGARCKFCAWSWLITKIHAWFCFWTIVFCNIFLPVEFDVYCRGPERQTNFYGEKLVTACCFWLFRLKRLLLVSCWHLNVVCWRLAEIGLFCTHIQSNSLPVCQISFNDLKPVVGMCTTTFNRINSAYFSLKHCDVWSGGDIPSQWRTKRILINNIVEF